MNKGKVREALLTVEQMLDYGDAPPGLVMVRELLKSALGDDLEAWSWDDVITIREVSQ
jgi:hypothetical protein